MKLTTVSSKNQISIPTKVLKALGLSKGSKVAVYHINDKKAIISKQPESYAESLRGLGKEVWDKLGGSEKYLQNERNSWDK